MKCKMCDKEFEKKAHNQNYCSRKCSNRRWRKNNPERYLEIIHKYRATEKGKIATRKAAIKYGLRHPERILESSRRWRKDNPERYLEVIHKYRATEKGKIATRKAAMKWTKTPKGRILKRKYRKSETYSIGRKNWLRTENGKKYILRKESKRTRGLSFIPIMDNPFPKETKINWHHTNNISVIPIPKKSHQVYIGNQKLHRIECNKKLREWGFYLNDFI